MAMPTHYSTCLTRFYQKDKYNYPAVSDTDFAARSMYHTMLQDIYGQTVFVRAIILNKPFISDWEDISIYKQ